MTMQRPRHPSSEGQALVEFALAITVFLVLLMGVADLGRGIYTYNGVSQAAREIARATSVHPGVTLGTSSQTASVVSVQQGLIPGLGTPTFTCVDIAGATISGSCTSGDFVKVGIAAPFQPVTLLLGLTGTWSFQSTSLVQIQ
jgi:hypothetical protein